MRKNWRLIPVLMCFVLLAGLCCGCGGTQEGQLTKISLCEVTHSVFYAPQYAALELGFFEEQGLEIELTNGNGADNVMTAVLSGQIDIGFAGPEASIYVYNEGREDYCQVFAQLTQRDGSFLVAREPDENFSWEKLEGQTLIPGRKGGVPYMTLSWVLAQNGLIPGENILFDESIQFELMAAAFASGTGDYVALFEPTASSLQLEGAGHIVASVGAESGEIPYTAYFASKSFIAENEALVQKFVDAIYAGQRWVQAHTAAEITAVIAPAFPDADLALLERAVESYLSIDAWCDTPVMTEESLTRLQTVMQAAGELQQTVPHEALVNNTFAEKAVS